MREEQRTLEVSGKRGSTQREGQVKDEVVRLLSVAPGCGPSLKSFPPVSSGNGA